MAQRTGKGRGKGRAKGRTPGRDGAARSGGRRTSKRGGSEPVSRQAVLRLLAADGGRPWRIQRLASRLGLRSGSPGARALRRLLRELEIEGLAERFDGQVRMLRADGLIEGEFRADGRSKGGRVRDVTGAELRVSDGAGARAGDRVLALSLGGGRAEVVQVVSPDAARIIGRLHIEERAAWLEPFARLADRETRVARGDCADAADGDVVEAVPLRRGRSPDAGARVVRRLGRPGERAADFAAIAWKYRLDLEFPSEVVREAEHAVLRAEQPGERRDLTALPFVTIDPATARDHDDAVCVEQAAGGALRLFVAIADVSHFVKQGGAIDREALRRGNSVYLPDGAIPMLPESLSSGACSLVPEQDRLVLVVELVVGPDGGVRRRDFSSARIRSRARLHYAQAARVMDGLEAPDVASELCAPLRLLAQVAARLRDRRMAQGSIELELPEAVVELDGAGFPTGSRKAARTVAHRAIEEAMLAANRAVAGWLDGRDVPTVHRIHEPPGDEALASLAQLLARFDLIDDAAIELTPTRVAAAVGRAVGRPIERLVHWSALRAMQQARYSTESRGHYALGFEHYLHFTSPIRRVADLAVHRAVHRALLGEASERDAAKRAERIALRASVRERVAQRAEREAVAIKRAALMEARVGECFDGHVSGLTRDGIFVTIDEPFVDGRLEASRLGAGFELEPEGLALVANRSKRRIALGDAISVRVESVDAFRGWIQFGPVKER